MNIKEKNNVIIYAHICKINNKVYIGQTLQKLNRRFRNGKGYIWNIDFWNDICKYGWHNFEHKIICRCNLDSADDLEKYYIKKYNSNKNGYNITTGGKDHVETGNPMYGKKQKDTTKDIIANKAKERAETKGLPWSKKVRCLETGKEYPTATAAALDTKCTQSSIIAVCRGRLKKTKNLHWEYVKEYSVNKIGFKKDDVCD